MSIELMEKQMTCWRCGGAGQISRGTEACPACSGTGEQARLRPASSSGYAGESDRLPDGTCPAWCPCHALAPRADQPCSSCGGSGYRMVTVRLPDGRYETRTDPCTGCGGSGRVQ